MQLTRISASASILAVAALAFTVSPKALHAEDETVPCVLGGPGTLCFTKQVQTCTMFAPSGVSVGTTNGVTTTCVQWTTTTQYYYRNNSGTGSTAGAGKTYK